MFRGNYSASVDERGRVRLPSAHLNLLREKYGDELFITSIDGNCLHVYPMQIWQKIEKKLLKIPSMNTSRTKLLNRLTFYGVTANLDKTGRILIPQRLRSSASLNGEVAVLGYLEYLEIWNPDNFMRSMESDHLTDDDRQLLSELGV